jgi:beta-glucosidase
MKSVILVKVFMVSKNNFPSDFLWGTATSAYQIEGAWNADGKSPSIWDTFSLLPGKTYHGQTGNKACRYYDLWEKDIELMKKMGVNAYRFSIAWTRIFPDNSGQVNMVGIAFYSRIINKLKEYGIEPFITMYHWDLPQYLQDEGGWISRETCNKFKHYALTLVQHFGDRVKFWTTINEPSVAAYAGHLNGVHAPGWKSPESALKVMHHLLLAHGMAVRAIRDRYNVKLGIALNLSPVFPADPHSNEDKAAAIRYDAYLYRSFLEALFLKEYPEDIEMKSIIDASDMGFIGERLDFLGINYYTRSTVKADDSVPLLKAKGVAAAPNEYSDMWEFYPEGLSQVIKSSAKKYKCPEIYITENGTSLPDELHDKGRVRYMETHLRETVKCLEEGISIKGYFAWSLLDNFEWQHGYTKRFGLIHVNFDTYRRTLKDSARWYSAFLHES